MIPSEDRKVLDDDDTVDCVDIVLIVIHLVTPTGKQEPEGIDKQHFAAGSCWI